MKKIYVSLFFSAIIFLLNSPIIFSQSPACANFSGVFISDSLEQNLQEYYICSGSNIYLKSLNNPSGATFQWKKNGVNISGETTHKINVTSEGLYSLTMTVGACTATSSGIIVRPAFSVANYYLTSNSITQACTGDIITLTTVKGLGLNYQWKKDNVNIVGAGNSSTYAATTTGSYSLTVTQGTCTFNSNNSISLNFSNSANPQIVSSKTIICEGKTTILRASNINATHSVQWLKDGIAISGATNKDSLEVSQTGNYVLQTTKGSCTGNSNALNVSITNLNLPAPQIQQINPNDFETCGNNVIKIKVKDYTDGSLTWLKDGNVIAGQIGAELVARESGDYAVRYQGNDLCYSQSAIIPVKISNVATLSFDGNDYTILSGQTATVNYTFNGTAPIVLGIKLGNNNFPGLFLVASNPKSFSFGNLTSTTTYSTYSFANACGVGTFSNPATITVGNCTPTTQIQTVNKSGSGCIGGNLGLTVTATGSGNLTYQWQKEGININGATGSSYNVSSIDYSNLGYYRVKVTGACGTVSSENTRINANYGDVVFAKLDYPAYTNSDILLTAFSGSSFGNASNAYRWAGPNGFTSTEQNPVIPNGTALNSGTYTVTATNAGGCVNYALLSVTVTTAPITLGNLGTTSFCPNGTLSVPFTTTLAIGTLYKVYLSDANGNFRNQSEIGNGMTSPIEITFPQYAQAGTKYRIKIVSTSPSATSSLSGYLSTDGQALTISVKNLIGREIYGGSICQGSALTGIINANQSGVTYEWKKDGVVQTTNSSLRITQDGTYKASVLKTGCSNISKTVNIYFQIGVDHYTVRLGDEYQCSGTSIIFKDSYYSDSASYQWRKDGNILIGQTKDSLIAIQTGIYNADVTDKCTLRLYSNSDKVVFSNVIEAKISLPNTPPINNLLCGNAIYINLYATNSTNVLAPYTYQWKRNGVNLVNQIYEYSPVLREGGLYNVSLTQGNCTVNSNGIELLKVDTIKLGLKVIFPYAKEICQGTETRLKANFPSGVDYTIYKDGVALANNPNPNYLSVNETGNYFISGNASDCVVVPSDTIKIIVGDIHKPRILEYSKTICNSEPAILSHWNFNNTLPNKTFQWFKNNQPIPNETNEQVLLLQPGFYKLRVTSGSCTGFTDSMEVKTGNLPKPIIYYNSNSFYRALSKLEICNNNTVHLYSSNTINDGYTVSNYADSLYWKRNNQLVYKSSGGFNQFTVAQSGTYTLVSKQGTCETESDPVEIKIGEPITANITGSTSIYPGQKAKLNLNFTGGNAWSYQTSDVATGQTTSLSPTLKNVSPASTQTFSITSIASNCGVGTVTGDATVTVLPCPTDKTISLNSGNWNTATTWTCGQIPTAAYDAIIENGHTVTLPNGYQGITKKLDLRGGLKQGVGASIRVNN